MILCLPLAALAALVLAGSGTAGLRGRFLHATVLFGAAMLVSTEGLGAIHQIRRTPLIVWWIVILAGALLKALPIRWLMPRFRADPIVLVCSTGIAAILILTALTAAFSPPNSADAMAYHMPRIVYWAEQSSVRFFPTAYFNQIMLQPFAEYMMLQTWVLSGGDRFINFVQWLASAGCILGVSCIAKELGAVPRGQAIAALFCATLPSGILASSGAKNDYVLAMWLVFAAYFALRFTARLQLADALFLGCALGLTLLTKATGYLYAPWPLAAIFITRARIPRKKLIEGALIAAMIALAINTPQYLRNYQLSGSVMGFDSAQGDGLFRWRNEPPGWRAAASNILRNLSDQLGTRSSQSNRRVYEIALAAHRYLGLDANDPATTWRGSAWGPPVNANHEADANNRWHLALLFLMTCVLVSRAIRRRDLEKASWAAGLICAFCAFCAYLKWQPFFARMLLPLFVLGAPLASLATGSPTVVQLALCLFLLNNSRPAVLENWVRPLKGPRSVLHAPRDDQYFADMTQWNNKNSYFRTADLLTRSNCNTIGIDITHLQLEYPLQALLRERNPAVRFVHSGVGNVSNRYPLPVPENPCAVVCLDCSGDSARLALYRTFDRSVQIDKFVIFLRQ